MLLKIKVDAKQKNSIYYMFKYFFKRNARTVNFSSHAMIITYKPPFVQPSYPTNENILIFEYMKWNKRTISLKLKKAKKRRTLYWQWGMAWYFQRVNNIRILYETSLQEMHVSCIRHLGLECFDEYLTNMIPSLTEEISY